MINPSTYRLYGEKIPAKAAARDYIERVCWFVVLSDIKEKYQTILKSRDIHTANDPQHLNQQKVHYKKVKEQRTLISLTEQDI